MESHDPRGFVLCRLGSCHRSPSRGVPLWRVRMITYVFQVVHKTSALFPWGTVFRAVLPLRVFRNPWNECLRSSDGSGGCFERCGCVFRPLEYLKDPNELCNLKHLSCLVAEVGKLDVTADLPSRQVHSHESTHAAAIEVSDISKVEHDL